MIYGESSTFETSRGAFDITVSATNEAIVGVRVGKMDVMCKNELTREAVRQLREYFDKCRTNFTLPLDMTFSGEATPFRIKVWQALMNVPYGEVVTYAALARMIGHPESARAVGGALAKNPLLILVPCHRVSSAGGIGGFSAGIILKRALLDTEKQI